MRARSISRVASLVISALVAVTAVAQQPAASAPPNTNAPPSAKPAAKPPSIQHHAKAEIKYRSQASLGKGLTKAVMTTGLTVLVQENHAAPVATVRCFVKNTGSAYEAKFLGMGLSHMLEHLVALGSTTKRAEEESQRLLDMMGGQTNAFTTTDLTAFYIDAPAKHADVAIELIADSMQNSIIPEKEYLREMGVVQRELEMGEADRGRMLHQATKELLFQEHPVRHPTIGYIAVVQQVTREEVIAFYKDRYVPQNLVFLVVGDVDTQHVLDEVLRNFQTFQRTTERFAVFAPEPDQASPRQATLEMEGPTTNFAIAWPTVELQHPDLYALDVASYLLTNGDSSRLGLRLKIDQPLALSVDSSSYTPGFVRGWFEIDVECEPNNLEPCQKIIQEELERLKEQLVPAVELDKVKRQKAAEHVFGQQRVQAQADSIAMSFISTGDPQFDDRYVEGIQSVTAEQIRDVARRYFVAHRTNRVTIDPLGTRRTTTEKSHEYEETPTIRRQLSNGLTVLLKRHSVTPVVTIQAFVRGGVLAETNDKSGLASVSCELMTRGTEKYSGREIAEYFDSIGGSFAVASQRNTSFLQCLVLANDWEKSLDYVDQVLFKPKFALAEFDKVKELQLAQIGARQANPQTEIMDFWAGKLPSSSPYSRTVQGSAETVKELTVTDCREFHKRYFVPNNMVLAVFGDIDPDRAMVLLEASLGKEPKSDEFAFPEFPPNHENVTGSSSHLKNQKANTAMIVIGFPTPPVSDVETRAKLEVLNAILTGGGGIGGRLFTELRGERLVYYVYGQELTGPAPGFFFFMAQTRPDTMQEVIKRIQSNLSKIAKDGVPVEEFELAKQKLMASHAMENVTPQSQAFQAAVDELLGLGYEHDRAYDDRISKVRVEDVKAVVQQYFQRAIIVTSSPEDSPGSTSPTGDRAARKK